MNRRPLQCSLLVLFLSFSAATCHCEQIERLHPAEKTDILPDKKVTYPYASSTPSISPGPEVLVPLSGPDALSYINVSCAVQGAIYDLFKAGVEEEIRGKKYVFENQHCYIGFSGYVNRLYNLDKSIFFESLLCDEVSKYCRFRIYGNGAYLVTKTDKWFERHDIILNLGLVGDHSLKVSLQDYQPMLRTVPTVKEFSTDELDIMPTQYDGAMQDFQEKLVTAINYRVQRSIDSINPGRR